MSINAPLTVDSQMGPGWFLLFRSVQADTRSDGNTGGGVADFKQQFIEQELIDEDTMILNVIKQFLGKRHESN